MHKKVFPASLNHLYDMMAFVQNFAIKQGFDSLIVDKIVLATEEALVNVIKYGYTTHQKEGEIEINCEQANIRPGIKILIKDQGVPFNPIHKLEDMKKKQKQIQSIEDCQLGGYGILIFVGLMDHVEYYRTDEGNFLFLVKYRDT